MKKILFAHGFASSGASGTVMTLRQMLYNASVSDSADEVRVIAPDLPVMPLEAMEMLRKMAADERPDLILGTSMGAFYIEQLRGFRRILVNPSFQMARLLTFGGMGRQEFRNKRADGARDFKVDKEMIAQFRTLEKDAFRGIDAAEKQLVWGLFGDKDKKVNHQKDFQKHYGKEHFIVFDGEHFLNDKVLSHSVLPVVKEVLGLD